MKGKIFFEDHPCSMTAYMHGTLYEHSLQGAITSELNPTFSLELKKKLLKRYESPPHQLLMRNQKMFKQKVDF